MIYVAYNSKLEHSFILDKCADFSLKNTMFEIKSDDHYLLGTKVDKKLIAEDEEETTSTAATVIPKVTVTKTVDSTNQPKTTKTWSLSTKKEISIDQSPLEEVKFGLTDEADESSNKDEEKGDEDSSGGEQQQQQQAGGEDDTSELSSDTSTSKLRLTICEQHKEKLNIGRTFKLLKDDLILSCSPFITFQMPFLLLESTNSTEDQLRKFLPVSYMNYLRSEILLRETHGALSPVITRLPLLIILFFCS